MSVSVTGGKGGGGFTDDYWYYGSWAGVLGIGPMDELVALSIDKREVWRPSSPILRSESANPYTFSVGVRGDVHFYWGTADQTLADPVLGPRERLHPAYRHRAVIVFDDFVMGMDRGSVPEIEVLVRRYPQQSVVTGSAAALDEDGQANPIAFLAELWTSETIGLGRSASELDTTSWQATAAALDADNLRYCLSPILRKAMTFDQLLDELRGYVSLWARRNSAGKIEIGLMEVSDPTVGGWPVITAADMTSPPSIAAHTLDETDTRLELRYLDRESGFTEERVRFESIHARLLNDRDRSAEVDREWITRGNQAQDKVARDGLREARPWDEIELSIFPNRAVALLPGAIFQLNYAPLSYSALCRVVSRKGDGDQLGAVSIEAETLREISAEF